MPFNSVMHASNILHSLSEFHWGRILIHICLITWVLSSFHLPLHELWILSQNEFKSWFMSSMHIQSLSNPWMIHNHHSRSRHPIAIFKCVMLGSWGNFPWARGQNLYPERMLSQFSVESYAVSPPPLITSSVALFPGDVTFTSLAEYQFILFCGLSHRVLSFSEYVFMLAIDCIRVMHTPVVGEEFKFLSPKHSSVCFRPQQSGSAFCREEFKFLSQKHSSVCFLPQQSGSAFHQNSEMFLSIY